MIHFENDYSEGAHPQIMEALLKTNLQQTVGYGLDSYCNEAAELLKKGLKSPEISCQIHFLAGGTQTNQTVISALLKPWEAVVAADTGHVSTHEAGAIEAVGHKVIEVPGVEGKLTPELVSEVRRVHSDEHMVKPRLVYISNPTEIGTVYTKSELEALSEYCRSHDLLLYLDGARLPMALTKEDCGLTLGDLARLCDAFYLGGTKCGALFGEALVFTLPVPEFRCAIKQRGGLMAKGRLLGVQFCELFKDDMSLYFQLARHANIQAERLRRGLLEAGYEMAFPSNTNQLFPILPEAFRDSLGDEFLITYWSAAEKAGYNIYRLVTSWATAPEDVDRFLARLKG